SSLKRYETAGQKQYEQLQKAWMKAETGAPLRAEKPEETDSEQDHPEPHHHLKRVVHNSHRRMLVGGKLFKPEHFCAWVAVCKEAQRVRDLHSVANFACFFIRDAADPQTRAFFCFEVRLHGSKLFG